jgi:hypothetical protein
MTSLLPSSRPPSLGPESSIALTLVALLFFAAVFAFYYYTR